MLLSDYIGGYARGKLRASTLVETLVTMLVAGIVLAAVMEGMTLFFRVQLGQVQSQYAAMRLHVGFNGLRTAVAAADSMRSASPGLIEIYRRGERLHLRLCNSFLLFESARRCDTLLSGLAVLHLGEYVETDTLTVGFANGFTIRFPVSGSDRMYNSKLAEIENGYGD